MDLPSLRLESPGQRPWVQKLALDSLPSPSPSQPNLQLQNLATKHWRKIRDNVFANSFISELQKEEMEEEREHNYISASEASSPQSPTDKSWIASPDASISLGPVAPQGPAPAVQLLQAQLQEATEEIERLYSEKEDVEHMLKQVRRSSFRLEHLPDFPEPESPEDASELLPAEEPQLSPAAVFDRKASMRNLSPSIALSEFPEEQWNSEHFAELLAEERRLRNQENDLWEIMRSHLEEKQTELELEVAAAYGEAEAAMERRKPSFQCQQFKVCY
eukprot:Skav212460  [mRNA]  locus=scaffold385:218290:219114:- [translate_table: standard]